MKRTAIGCRRPRTLTFTLVTWIVLVVFGASPVAPLQIETLPPSRLGVVDGSVVPHDDDRLAFGVLAGLNTSNSLVTLIGAQASLIAVAFSPDISGIRPFSEGGPTAPLGDTVDHKIHRVPDLLALLNYPGNVPSAAAWEAPGVRLSPAAVRVIFRVHGSRSNLRRGRGPRRAVPSPALAQTAAFFPL